MVKGHHVKIKDRIYGLYIAVNEEEYGQVGLYIRFGVFMLWGGRFAPSIPLLIWRGKRNEYTVS